MCLNIVGHLRQPLTANQTALRVNLTGDRAHDACSCVYAALSLAGHFRGALVAQDDLASAICSAAPHPPLEAVPGGCRESTGPEGRTVTWQAATGLAYRRLLV